MLHVGLWLVVYCAAAQAQLRESQTAGDAPRSKKPNILLIYSDDHGWADLGAQSADKDVRTPNLDRLARDGVRFTRGYVSAPQCVPSRAGVITGRYQQRFGVEDNNHGPLPLAERTIAELLHPVGYLSGWVGKSHLDLKAEKGTEKAARVLPEHLPHRQGFEEYFRGEVKQFHASHDLQGRPFADAPRVVTDNRFRVVVQTEAALSFLERRARENDRPWFLYLAWYAPHVPLESPEPWFSQTPETLPLKRRQALAMIAAMDDGLGRIRAKLKAMNVERDTLIFFIGDNGAPLGEAWDGSLNSPLVGQKGMLAEGGIRTPFIAAWPATWPAGIIYDHPVINLDVAATAIAAAGLPPDPRLDGVDLAPFVTGRQTMAPHERLFWRWGSQSAVLEMPFKLVKLGDRPAMLFDVTRPDGENVERNLASRRPEIVKRLERHLRQWAGELEPPGLSEDRSAFSRRHEQLFAEHRIIAAESPSPASPATSPAKGTDAGAPKVNEAKSSPAETPTIQNWLARNGTLAFRDGAMILTPASDAPKNARPFLANSQLDFQGPATAVLRVRSKEAGDGQATLTWRTTKESFAAHQATSFDWPAGDSWSELRVAIPEKARIRHVRLSPPKNSHGVEIQGIEFHGARGETQVFKFDAARTSE